MHFDAVKNCKGCITCYKKMATHPDVAPMVIFEGRWPPIPCDPLIWRITQVVHPFEQVAPAPTNVGRPLDNSLSQDLTGFVSQRFDGRQSPSGVICSDTIVIALHPAEQIAQDAPVFWSVSLARNFNEGTSYLGSHEGIETLTGRINEPQREQRLHSP